MVSISLSIALCLATASDDKFATWTVQQTQEQDWPLSVAGALSAAELAKIDAGQPVPPFGDLTSGLRAPDGTLWIGSQRGLTSLSPGAKRWNLFHSRRWLPDDRVQGVALDSEGNPLVKTAAGVVRFVRVQRSLDEKMAEVQAMLRKHHVRHGLVGEVNLKEPGKLDLGWTQPSSDNDGLWTSLYVAAEVYRYGATRDPEAKKNARQSLEVLMFLERITGIPGFAARSVVPIEDDPKKYGGEWHRSADGRWWWKGDTSSDELDGHYFAYALYYDIAATDDERTQIRDYVTRITDHILDHGYYYVGPPGKPTTWGVWAPEKLNHDLTWLDDRGLNSLEILSHLKVADHVSDNPRYAKAAKDLIERHAYAINTVEQKMIWPPDLVNHSDDELAFLAYHPLLVYERDPKLRKIYLASLRRSWLIERPERSPFFNLIYASCLQASEWTNPMERPKSALVPPEAYDRDACLEWFRDVPVDTIGWEVKNSARRDLGPKKSNRSGGAYSEEVLPISERRVMKWNGDPYGLDGGSGGRDRDDGTFILLPYWMGRYYRFIE